MGLGIAVIVARDFELSFFVVNMITMIGLALGIDYSLFIISRFREERASARRQGRGDHAGDTASRAVFFSGSTFFVALLGLFLVPSPSFAASPPARSSSESSPSPPR